MEKPRINGLHDEAKEGRPSAAADSAYAHINTLPKSTAPARYPPKRPPPPSKEPKMSRPYQSQPHLAAPSTITTTMTVNGTSASTGPTLGYGSTLGFPTIHPSSHRRHQNNHHFTQSFVDRPTPVQAGPVPKAATASPDIGRTHGWTHNGNSAGPQYGSYPSAHKQRPLHDYHHYQQQQQQQQQKPQQPHNSQYQSQKQQQQQPPLKQHLSYPLSKNEYRHNYQSGNQDYYSNNGYADRHGYMLDSQWNESPQDSPPDLDFGYYLSKILQIPDMRDQQQQHYYYQQQQHQQHMQQQQQQHLESPLDMPIPTSNMQRMHKRPVSMTDPVSLLSWKPHKSALSKRLNQPPTYADEYLASAYVPEHSYSYSYSHDYRHDYSSSGNHNNASGSGNGNGLAAYIEQKHRMQQQQQKTQWHASSQYYEHIGTSEHRRKDFAKYTDESHAASSAKVRRRKSDYGPQMSVADGSAKPFKQYRYDDRFSLSMEHLPLYNNLPSS
ncbi:hypothetical protein IWW39_003789 [Coemansia spiralis]|uniref:Uncharacterized protein n=1 Tax=Coemansia spiralis TaxID=417178 RepID=A0A9W8L394_9FUNG|nr:hypothetical protein IWW39_003789 [Coemansia spiralis]